MDFENVTGRLAVVFGASGFIGRHTVRALARAGWRVRCGVRRPDLAGFLQPMGTVGQVMAVQANLRYRLSIAQAVTGAAVVVNCVGLLASSGRQTFGAIHVNGAKAVAKAAREAGVSRLIHISSLGADLASKSTYGRTKAEGEAAVLQEFPDALIVRPSLVFGPEDDFFNRFANMAALSPVLPLIGGGRTRMQPVFVGDLAQAVANACAGQGTPGTVFELGGPETLTMRQLLDECQAGAGRARAYVPLPFFLAKAVALATWPLPNGLRPLTVDQVRLLQRDNVVSQAAQAEGRTISALGVEALHTIGAVVPGYLERFKPHGQFSHYRG